MRDFEGRDGVALVTGGSGGIGAEVCRLLAARGAALVVTYRRKRPDELLAQLHQQGHAAVAVFADLSDGAATAEMVERVRTEHGGLHTVVHAAGPHVPMTHLSRVTPSQFAAQLQGDAAAFFNLVHACLPALRETRGSVVAVTTAATSRYPVRDGLSAGPKGAVEALVRGFAAEEGRYGVRLNAVGPGMLTDGMAARLIASGDLDEDALEVTRRNIPLRRFGTAEDIAEAACFLASARAGFVTGQKLDVDGGYGV